MRPLLSPGGFDMGRGVEALVYFQVGRRSGGWSVTRSVRLILEGHDCLTQLATAVRAMRGVYMVSVYPTDSYAPDWEVLNRVHARPTAKACRPQKGALFL